ncbi:MAG: hypothetical protein N3D73_01550 [Candidatus Diapherotrites archaeon]|nr:hypothetical protein [Candidatus Diapherotrites archaeon]
MENKAFFSFVFLLVFFNILFLIQQESNSIKSKIQEGLFLAIAFEELSFERFSIEQAFDHIIYYSLANSNKIAEAKIYFVDSLASYITKVNSDKKKFYLNCKGIRNSWTNFEDLFLFYESYNDNSKYFVSLFTGGLMKDCFFEIEIYNSYAKENFRLPIDYKVLVIK